MAITAMRIGYGSDNADNERIINAVRKRAHYFFGLPEPSFNNRRIKNFVNKHIKADDLCDPSLLPNKIQKRNKESKILKIMISDPEILHQGWRHAIQTIGKKAPFVRIVQVMNNKFASVNKNKHLKYHDLLHFFHLQSGTLNRERFRPRLTDEHKEKELRGVT